MDGGRHFSINVIIIMIEILVILHSIGSMRPAVNSICDCSRPDDFSSAFYAWKELQSSSTITMCTVVLCCTTFLLEIAEPAGAMK